MKETTDRIPETHRYTKNIAYITHIYNREQEISLILLPDIGSSISINDSITEIDHREVKQLQRNAEEDNTENPNKYEHKYNEQRR